MFELLMQHLPELILLIVTIFGGAGFFIKQWHIFRLKKKEITFTTWIYLK